MRCLLQSWTVPVVYGGGDYSQHLPPNSYIAAGDFQTARELAAHLLWLMEKPEEYLKYFWWKSHYQILEEISPERPHSLPASFACRLCEYLNTQTGHKQERKPTNYIWKVLNLLLSRSPTSKHSGKTRPSVRPGSPIIATEMNTGGSP